MADTKTLYLSASLLFLTVSATPLVAQTYQSQFNGLGFMNGAVNYFYGHPYGINASGSVVVGESTNESGQREAFRWSAETGTVGLGFIGTGGDSPASVAIDVSSDGAVIVGYGRNPDEQYEAFRWTSETGMVGLGFVGGGGHFATSYAYDVSDDGAVVVGSSRNARNYFEAFRWTAETNIVGLGFIGDGGSVPASSATAMSANGAVIVGRSTNASGLYEAFRWTAETKIVGLGFIDGGGRAPSSSAEAVNDDGTVVVGTSTNMNGRQEAFRWTTETNMMGLGFIDGGGSVQLSFAYGVSADGSVVVGASTNANNQQEAFRWTARTGMQSVAGILKASGVLLSTWRLDAINALSSDGTLLIGSGVDPNGQFQPWIVRIVELDPPTPPTPPIPPGPVPPVPPPPRPSIIDFKEMQATIRDTAGIVLQSGAAVSSSLDDMRFAALQQCQPGKPEAGRFCLYATGSAGFWANNGDISDGRNLSGTAGVAVRVAPGVQAGIGFSAGKARYDLRLGGKNDVTAYGASGFLSYAQNGYEGLQLLAAGTIMQTDLDIRRSYMNGVSMVSQSKGSTNGYGAGALGRIGWGMRVLDQTWVTPFAEVSWSRMRNNGYTETGGVFPIRFDRQRLYETTLRSGVELRHQLNADITLFGSAAWLHRLSGEGSSLNGVMVDVFNLSSGKIALKNDWAELSAGASWTFTQNARLSGSVSTALGNDNKPTATLRLGIAADF